MRLNQNTLRPRAACQVARWWVIGVQDGEIIWLLVFEDARFGVDVAGERLVAVEMVGRDVQNRRRSADGMSDDGFQLKARNLEHRIQCLGRA